jgi:hypothetical protein
MKHCKHCEAIIPASCNVCPVCKKEQPVKKAALAKSEFEMVTPQIAPTVKKTWPTRDKFNSDTDWIKGCIAFASEMNYNANSALNFVLRAVDQDRKVEIMKTYATVKSYKSGWIDRQLTLRSTF